MEEAVLVNIWAPDAMLNQDEGPNKPQLNISAHAHTQKLIWGWVRFFPG